MEQATVYITLASYPGSLIIAGESLGTRLILHVHTMSCLSSPKDMQCVCPYFMR